MRSTPDSRQTTDGSHESPKQNANLSVGVLHRFAPHIFWLRGLDLNQRPLGYEPNELPDCSTPRLSL